MSITHLHHTGHEPQHRVAARALVLTLLACVVLITYLTLAAVPTAAPVKSVQAEPGKLSMAFVPNRGQAQAEVKFLAHDLNQTVSLTSTDLVFSLAARGQKEATQVRISHQNARADAAVSGTNLLKGQVNYLLGQNPARWQTHLPTYASVMVQDLYPGIDLAYEGMPGAIEGIYTVKPGADPAQIRWQHSVAARVNPASGAIELFASSSAAQPVLVEKAPLAYQQINGKPVVVPSRFAQNADGSFAIALGAYDTTQTLVIDPTLTYSSYFGGGELDSADGIALDASGNIYVTGLTSSTDFLTSATKKGDEDAFVLKLNPTGSEILYSTYLGGTGDEEGNSIAVDSTGSVYIAGDTTSADFPLKNAFDTSCPAVMGMCTPDAFLTRLSPDGSQLVYSSYLGGANMDTAQGVVVDGAGQAYLTGQTFSTDFQTKPAGQTSLKGGADAFVTHVDTTASGAASLVWSQFLGGSSVEFGSAIALNGAQLVLTGTTTSTDFPVKTALQGAYQGKQDVFITGMTTAGAVSYSTYLGGADQDTSYGITANAQGAYLTGTTLSTNFPTQTPMQDSKKGGNDAFVTGISPDGSHWLFSTYLGGKDADFGYSIATDPAGGIYVTGSTASTDFTTVKTMQIYGGGEEDAFVAKFEPTGGALVYSTLLGGSDAESGAGIAVDSQGASYIVGNTFSADLPLVSPYDDQYGGKGDIFVSILTDTASKPVIPALSKTIPLEGSTKTASVSTVALGETVTYTITLHNNTASTATADVMDVLPKQLKYVDGSANQGGVYDSKNHLIDWQPIDVAANSDVALTYTLKYETASTDQKAINVADIIVNQTTKFQRFATVNLGGSQPADQRPVIKSFWIGEQDLLTSRDVTLHLQATDDGTVVKMYLLEWQVNPKPVPHWERVKSSGWIPYEAAHAWTLGELPGVHYIAAVVADDQSQVSLFSMDYASLLLPDTALQGKGYIPYLVSYAAGVDVTATLTHSAGSPELFVWYPNSYGTPDKHETSVATFHTDAAGRYYFLMYAGDTAATYTLQITPAGGPQMLTSNGSSAGGETAALTSDPILSVIGFDPLGSGTGTPPTAVQDHFYYLPAIRR